MPGKQSATFLQRIAKRVEQTHPPMNGFAWFGIINYPIFYFIWQNTDPMPALSLFLRVTATILSIILLFRDHWPGCLKRYLPVFWLFTVLFCLPFFACLLLLVNQLSSTWTLNVMFSLCMMIVLLDWASFVVLFLLGAFCAWAAFIFMNDPSVVDALFISQRFQGFDIILLMTLFAGALLSYELDLQRTEAMRMKLEAMKALGGSIAHELRTPLSAIKMATDGMRLRLQRCLNSEEQDAVQTQEQLPKIDEGLVHVQAECDAANLVIDMLLMNIRSHDVAYQPGQSCSLNACVDEALDRYPFSGVARSQVNWIPPEQDIVFEGNQLWMEHLLFNLLKNALYVVHGQKDGKIEIWCAQNVLHFKDNGGGIPAEQAAHIFDRFYSKTRHGTGLGLAFCQLVMESIGGSIDCVSTPGDSTEFLMQFNHTSKAMDAQDETKE